MFKTLVRLTISTVIFVAYFGLTYYYFSDDLLVARKGNDAVATVIACTPVARDRQTYYRSLVNYDGRSSNLESEEEHKIGEKIPVRYVSRAEGDVIRANDESTVAWLAIIFLLPAALCIYDIVRAVGRAISAD